MLNNRNKGKILINVEKDGEKINSNMIYRGIAKNPEVTLTTLLVNFVSLCLDKGKNPKNLIDKNLQDIINSMRKEDQIVMEGGGTKPPPLANH